MDLLKTALIFVVVTSGCRAEINAAPFNQATVRRIIDGREVFIDSAPASVNQSAERGQEVSTGSSRAELLFDRRALGFLGLRLFCAVHRHSAQRPLRVRRLRRTRIIRSRSGMTRSSDCNCIVEIEQVRRRRD